MELTKFVLMMFIWPAGQAEDKPLWTNSAYLTAAECEAGAEEIEDTTEEDYGADVRIAHYCISIDDRLDDRWKK